MKPKTIVLGFVRHNHISPRGCFWGLISSNLQSAWKKKCGIWRRIEEIYTSQTLQAASPNIFPQHNNASSFFYHLFASMRLNKIFFILLVSIFYQVFLFLTNTNCISPEHFYSLISLKIEIVKKSMVIIYQEGNKHHMAFSPFSSNVWNIGNGLCFIHVYFRLK